MRNHTKDLGKIQSMTVKDLSEVLKNGDLSAKEITESFLNRIETIDRNLNAFITITKLDAIKTAEAANKILEKKENANILTGIPCGIKDNICTKGIKTTCASRFLKDFVPPYDAFVSGILKNVASPVLGKLNLDEFAMGSTTENSYFGPTKNPHNILKVPGGSSGGPAAAVAAGEVPFAIGSDTGGSVRQPAAFCGVVGMKPTYGRISRNGLIAFASSFDQIGILTKDVLDNALILSELAIHDKNDATNLRLEKEDFAAEISSGVKGMRIGIPKEFIEHKIHPEVKRAFETAVKIYEKEGAEITEVSIPELKYALHAYYIISGAEASSNLARYDGIRFGHRAESYNGITELYKNSRSEGFGPEVKRRIMTGTYVLSEGQKDRYYQKALKICQMLKCSFKEIFAKTDVILTPTAPTPAFDLGTDLSAVSMYLNDIFTVPANIAGLPAISIPCGKTSEQLPLAVQLTAERMNEKALYKAAFALEKEYKI